MADKNDEMMSLMAAMEETKTGPASDDVDVLLAEPSSNDVSVRGRAEKERAEKREREKDGSSRIFKKVLPIVGAGMGALVLGIVLGAVLFGSSGGGEERVVHEIDAVNLKTPILEQLDSIKDAQIRSLEKQFTEIASENMNTGDDAAIAMAAPFSQMNSTSVALNGLLDTAIALSPTASDTEVRIAIDQVSDFMTQSGVTNAYKFMTGASPAKDLNIDCRKASLATMTLSGMSSDGSALVAVATVPVMASDSTIHTALYVVLIDGDRVESCEYVGLLSNGGGTEINGALQNAYTTLATLKGDAEQSVSIGVNSDVSAQADSDSASQNASDTPDGGESSDESQNENASSDTTQEEQSQSE